MTPAVRLERNPRLESRQVDALREAVGWQIGAFDYAAALERSYGYYGLLEGTQLLGFLNLISDGVTYALIVDVMIHPEFQGRGLGRLLVETAVDDLRQDAVPRVCALYDPHLRDFYADLGFESLEGGMLRLTD